MMSLRLMLLLGILLSAKIYGAPFSGLPIANSPYSVKHYTDENGLPQNSVKALLQDPEGFVWFVTESGLVRFDGRNFSVFNKSSLPLTSSSFYTIQPGIYNNAGKFYAIAANSEVLGITKSSARIDSLYYPNLLRKIPLLNNPETLLYTGAPNYLWGISLNRFKNYVILSSSRKNTYFVVHKDEIEFYTGRQQQGKIRYGKYKFNEFFGLNGKLYHCLANGQIVNLELTGITKLRLSGDILKDPSFRSDKKNFTVFSNHLSDQAFVLLNQNFYLLEPKPGGNFGTRLILQDFDFKTNHIVTVLYDPLLKRLFLGSLTKGLFMFSQKQFQPVQIKRESWANVIYAQTFDKNNIKLISNGGDLLTVPPLLGYSRQQGVLHLNNIKTKSNQNLDERAILTDTLGRTWCTAREHLRVYDKDSTKVLSDWKLSDKISTISLGFDGRIWIGLYQNGLAFLDSGDPLATPKPFIKENIPRIGYILPYGPHHLWLGTEKGIFSLDLRSRDLILIPGTEKLVVRSLLLTRYRKKNYLFFTTYDDGIFLYHNNKLTTFPLDAKRSLATAHCLIEDQNGFLWIPTNRGLFQVAKRDLLQYAEKPEKNIAPFYMHYAKGDGFLSNEFNGGCQPCAAKLPGGIISLPSMEGLVWFKPEKIRVEVPDKKIFVDWLRVMGKNISFNDSTIYLPVSPEQISLQISTPYFGAANNLQMYYTISQKSKQPTSWIKLNPDEPIVYFSELQSGTHQLLIKKMNGFGLNKYSLKGIKIIVAPHWYETTWFLIFCILALALLLHLYSRVRNGLLRLKNIKLENKIKMRTSDLRAALSVLQRSEKALSRQTFIQTRLVASISHDIKSPLVYLGMLTSSIEKLIIKQDFAMVADISRDLSNSVVRMNSFLDNLLAYTKSQIYEQNKTEKVALYSIVKEKKELFLPHIKRRGSMIINEVPETCYIYSNANLLKIIIHNLIDNANKYTYQGIIRVFTVQRPDGLHLIVSDNGPGFPKQVLEWFNMPAYSEQETKTGTKKENPSGLGLLIVKDLATVIKAKLWLENDKGAQVHLIFQESSLGSNHQ